MMVDESTIAARSFCYRFAIFLLKKRKRKSRNRLFGRGFHGRDICSLALAFFYFANKIIMHSPGELYSISRIVSRHCPSTDIFYPFGLRLFYSVVNNQQQE
jgi:hypothetical protein